jgi:hypothetical protein
MGWPGQYGHDSFAALSHTVKTKSSFGAPGAANSSHDLLRSPAVEIPADSIWLSASGRGCPDGWLPALYAVNLPLPLRFRIASAMIDRAELPVHRNRTL